MQHYEIDKTDGVATVTLKTRTMSPDFFRATGTLFEGLHEDAELRCVVIRSEEKAFSYGLDLPAAFGEYGELFTGGGLAEPRTRLLRLIGELQESFTAVATLPVPTICAVHGWCIGGGLDLAAACDIRLGSDDAVFSLRETKIAIVADLGSLQRLHGIVGKGLLRELAFTGRDVDAEEAARMGLINRVCGDRDALHGAAAEMAREIAANPPLTVRGVKKVLDFSEDHTVADGLEYVAAWNSAFLSSEDLAEAVSAFMEKREPKYRGR